MNKILSIRQFTGFFAGFAPNFVWTVRNRSPFGIDISKPVVYDEFEREVSIFGGEIVGRTSWN